MGTLDDKIEDRTYRLYYHMVELLRIWWPSLFMPLTLGCLPLYMGDETGCFSTVVDKILFAQQAVYTALVMLEMLLMWNRLTFPVAAIIRSLIGRFNSTVG